VLLLAPMHIEGRDLQLVIVAEIAAKTVLFTKFLELEEQHVEVYQLFFLHLSNKYT